VGWFWQITSSGDLSRHKTTTENYDSTIFRYDSTISHYDSTIFHYAIEVEKSAQNLGHVYAHRAKVCPESGARDSDLGKVCPESGVRDSDLGKVCPESGACFCPPCINVPRIWGKEFRPRESMPRIWGMFLPPVQKSALKLRQGFLTSEWSAPNLRHKNTSSEWLSLLFGWWFLTRNKDNPTKYFAIYFVFRSI
jgi:hypothetical protein